MRATLGVVARNLSWLAAGEVAVKAGLFVAGVVVARGLGAAAMGAFTVVYGAALVLMLGVAAGQVEGVIRKAARTPRAARALAQEAGACQRQGDKFGQVGDGRVLFVEDHQCLLGQILGMVPRYS